MGVMILRPGQRLVAPHVRIVQPSMAAAAASGWWLSGGISAANCVAAYAPKGAASLAASYSNLNNPGTNNAAPGVAPTFATASGWTFNGTTQYLTTGIVPGNNYSAIVRFTSYSAPTTSNAAIVGSAISSAPNTGLTLGKALTTGALRFRNGDVGYTDASTATSGVMAAAGANAYLNGSSVSSGLGGSGGNANAMMIGALNFGGTINSFSSVIIIAVAIYNTTLSGSQVSALTTAMNAL